MCTKFIIIRSSSYLFSHHKKLKQEISCRYLNFYNFKQNFPEFFISNTRPVAMYLLSISITLSTAWLHLYASYFVCTNPIDFIQTCNNHIYPHL